MAPNDKGTVSRKGSNLLVLLGSRPTWMHPAVPLRSSSVLSWTIPINTSSSNRWIYNFTVVYRICNCVCLLPASRYAGIAPPVSPHIRKWIPISKEKLMAYFILCMTIGFHKLPCSWDFCSHHGTVRVELFPHTMSWNQFDYLTTHLHFTHLEAPDPEDSD